MVLSEIDWREHTRLESFDRLVAVVGDKGRRSGDLGDTLRLGKRGILNPRMKGYPLIPFLVENQVSGTVTVLDLSESLPQQAKDQYRWSHRPTDMALGRVLGSSVPDPIRVRNARMISHVNKSWCPGAVVLFFWVTCTRTLGLYSKLELLVKHKCI